MGKQKQTILKEGEDPMNFNSGTSVMVPGIEQEEYRPGGSKQVKEHLEINKIDPPGIMEAIKKSEEKEEKQRPLPPATPKVNPLTDENGLLVGSNFEEQWKIASLMASSEMVPDNFRNKPAAVLMAMQTAKSRGINPLTAIQQMANLFGRTINFGELPLGEAIESGKLKYFEEFWIDKDGKRIDDLDIKAKVFGCVTIAEAHNSPQGRVVRVFTLDDASQANLLDDAKRKTWRQYTKRMLQMRSRGWALKDCVPSVTSGLSMPEYEEHAEEPRIELKPSNLANRLLELTENESKEV